MVVLIGTHAKLFLLWIALVQKDFEAFPLSHLRRTGRSVRGYFGDSAFNYC